MKNILEVKETINKCLTIGSLKYVKSSKLIEAVDKKEPLYVLLYSDNKDNKSKSKKYIFEVISYKLEKYATLANVKNIITGAGFLKEVSSAMIRVEDIIGVLTNEEIKTLFTHDYIIKYSAIKTAENREKSHSIIKNAEYTNEKVTKEKEKTMNVKNKRIENMLNVNTDSAKVASSIAAGSTLNKVVLDKIKPQLPVFLRGYAEQPLASVVLANLVVFAVQNFAKDNKRAEWVAESMLVAAMTEFMTSFDLEGLLNEVITTASVNVPDSE